LTGSSGISGTGNTLANVLTGNSGANTLIGGDGNDTLNGGAGSDTLDGGAGIDRMVGGLGNDTYIVDILGETVTESADQGTDVVQAAITYTLGANVENLILTGISAINGTGNALANVLTGNSAANTLTGGAGNDTLNAGEGSDILTGGVGTDRMVGGLGDDTYVVDILGDTVVENVNEGTDVVQTAITYTLGANVENLLLTGTTAIDGTGNSLDNVLTGNGAANILTGGSGNDTLNAGAGSDTLIGGVGSDQMLGGSGNDTYVVDVADDTVTELAGQGTDLIQSGISYILGDNLENLTLTGSSAIGGTGNALANILTGNSAANILAGGLGNDTLKAGDGSDTLDGGAGRDQMQGGLGNDTYIVDSSGDVITENADGGTDLVQASITYTLADYVENLLLTGTSAINGTGNSLDNILTGNSAANTLTGGLGNDRMFGGLGNDTYVIDSTGDMVTEAADAGIDTVKSAITYTLLANVENLTLTGSEAIDGLGNSLANLLTGNGGANLLNGGTGADTLLGGAGDDRYIVDNTLDVVTESASQGLDTVEALVTFTLGANVENLKLTGTAAINGTGNSLANLLTGNSAANTLLGGSGNDTLNGQAGSDILTGGSGNDTFVFNTALNAATNKDSISDFTLGQDKIELQRSIFTSLPVESTLLSQYFNASVSGAAADDNDYILYNTTSGALLYDADGNGQGVAIEFATLTNKPAITAGDFLIVT
ncbi:MAG: calcium-binding protein, partial [Pseudomonadota bacterium]